MLSVPDNTDSLTHCTSILLHFLVVYETEDLKTKKELRKRKL